MSSKVDTWSEMDGHWLNPAREYYLSHTLECFSPGTIRGMSVLFFIVGGLGALLTIVAVQTDGTMGRVLWWMVPVLAVVTLWALGCGLWFAGERLEGYLRQDDAEGKKVREPLVRRVREFAEHQDLYVGLMEISQRKLEAWVIDSGGYYTIRDEWPADFGVHAKLVSEPYYTAAVRNLYPVTSTGHKVSPGNAPFEKIIDKRKRIYEWATRETTPEQRAKANIARSEAIDAEKELARQRLNNLAGSVRRPTLPPPPGAEDL